jgi:hypothetical protein
MANQARFKIRNFGNDVECKDTDELQEQLLNYKGRSVTIEDRSGRSPVLSYVDVSNSGEVSWSYSESPLEFAVDFA